MSYQIELRPARARQGLRIIPYGFAIFVGLFFLPGLQSTAFALADWRLAQTNVNSTNSAQSETEKDRTLQEARKLSIESMKLREAGKYDEARPLAERVLEIIEKALGKEDPDLILPLINLARIRTAQGHYAEAEPLYKRALSLSEKTLGKDHPDTARSLNNLATLYRQQGRYDDAEILYRRAIAIAEVTLGPEHPDMLTFLEGYSALLHKMKREDKAINSVSTHQ
jgi:tetratricopeptide (TPR) repeat protein